MMFNMNAKQEEALELLNEYVRKEVPKIARLHLAWLIRRPSLLKKKRKENEEI